MGEEIVDRFYERASLSYTMLSKYPNQTVSTFGFLSDEKALGLNIALFIWMIYSQRNRLNTLRGHHDIL